MRREGMDYKVGEGDVVPETDTEKASNMTSVR